jgi:hypothetical protein
MFFFGSFYKELFNVEHHKYGSIISDYPKKYLTWIGDKIYIFKNYKNMVKNFPKIENLLKCGKMFPKFVFKKFGKLEFKIGRF